MVFANAFAFLFYGYNCIFSVVMDKEFRRFGLTTTQRKLTGVLQILGASGLLLGLFYPKIGFAASLGLSILMLLGFIVRLRIKDSFLESAPSFIFMLLNAYLAYRFWEIV